MLRWILCAIFILQLSRSFTCTAQNLHRGDKLPFSVVHNVFNADGDTYNLALNAPPLTILVFWETNCIPCIGKFPWIDSFQKRYKGQVQFVMVNRRSKDSTRRFFENRSKVRLPKVPFVTADSVLEELFPHNGVPYTAWLDRDLRVLGFGNQILSDKYIKSTLSGVLLPEPMGSPRSIIKPILNYEYDNKFVQISMLTRCTIGYMPTDASDYFRKNAITLGVSCQSIEMLYKIAYSGGNVGYFGEAIIEFQTKDRSIVQRPEAYEPDWYKNHCYSYKLIVPRAKESFIYDYMKEDLERYFGYKVISTSQRRKCIVLGRIAQSEYLRSKGTAFVNTLNRSSLRGDISDSLRVLNNGQFSQVLNAFKVWFKDSKPGLLFVNNSGVSLTERVDLMLSGTAVESMDIGLLNKELSKYGLKLEEKLFDVEIFVIREEELP